IHSPPTILPPIAGSRRPHCCLRHTEKSTVQSWAPRPGGCCDEFASERSVLRTRLDEDSLAVEKTVRHRVPPRQPIWCPIHTNRTPRHSVLVARSAAWQQVQSSATVCSARAEPENVAATAKSL